MGVTYKAFDIDLRCPVTLKVISEKYVIRAWDRLRCTRKSERVSGVSTHADQIRARAALIRDQAQSSSQIRERIARRIRPRLRGRGFCFSAQFGQDYSRFRSWEPLLWAAGCK